MFFKFKYSDGKDKILLLVGTIFAFGAAGVYPLMFFAYGKVVNTFVDLEKWRVINSTEFQNTTFNQSDFW